MRTTPMSFYELFVRPNWQDFKEAPADARLGFNAAVSAFQSADIFYKFFKNEDPRIIRPWPKFKSFLIHLSKVDPSFLTIQSVATVYKHLHAAGGHYTVGSPGAVWGVSIPNEKIELTSDFQNAKDDVLVRRLDGSTVSLSDALNSVVDDMWPKMLPDCR